MDRLDNLEARKDSVELPTALLDSIGTLVVVTDTEGRIVHFNSACEQLTGYSRTEAIARPIWEQCIPSQAEQIKAIYRSLEAGEPESYVATWVTRTGEQRISWTHSIYRTASEQYLISTGIDARSGNSQNNPGSQTESFQDETLQQLLLNISNYFVDLDINKVDRGINQTLEAIAKFTDSDRAYLYQTTDGETLSCTNWTPSLSAVEAPPSLPASSFPGWNQLQQLEPVSSRLADLDSEAARDYCDRNGTKSLLAVPLASRGHLFGLVGIEVVSLEKEWLEEDLSLLQIVADILINAVERQRSEQELQKNYRLLEAVVNASTDAIFIKDCQGCYQLINETAAQMVNKSIAEIIGRDDTTLFPPDIAAKVQANDREVIASGTPKVFEDLIIADGKPMFLLSSKNVYRDAQGQIAGIVGVSKDITPIKQAQAALEQRVQERTAELSKANQELQYHLENTPLAVVEWNRDFRVKRWSARAEEMFGWSSAEVLGKHPSEWQFVCTDDLEAVERAMAELYEAKETYNFSANRNITKSGAVVHCEWYNSIFFDDKGNPISVLSLAQDVTARKQAEAALKESEERLRIFIENAPSAIAMFDRQMRYLAASQRWLTDYNLEGNIIGRSHYEIFPEIPARWKADHQRCLAGVTQSCEEDPFVRADGTTDWVRWELHPWYKNPGEVGGIIMFTEVITERVKVQHQLLALNQELRRSNAELEQFAYVASHDLREPLRKIKSYTELLAQRCDYQLDAKASKYMASIVNASSRMQDLISDLLTYSRVGRGELVVEPIDLNQELKHVLDNLRVPIQKNNATVNIHKLPTVSANPRQMEQLFQNLIANAIKFRGEAEPVVEIKAELQEEWLICVADNGIGIDPKYAERVFAIFQRLHGRGKYEGTGIGLAICRKIVERHGGKIWLESEPGKGTTFYFTLKSV